MAATLHAFDEGPWPRLSPFDRERMIQRIADRIRARADEPAEIDIQP